MACHLKPSAAGFRSLTSAARSSLLKSPRSSSFHTATSPIPRISRTSPTSTFFPLRNQTPNALAITTARHASSSAPTSNQPDIPKDVLTWDRFFGLRRTRRYVNLGASVITGGGALLVLGPVLAQQDIDAWAAQVSGLDPMMVLGITGIAIAAGGWLCGPTFGNGAFKIWAARKGWNHSIAEKEKSFFARIKRYRADPASSSIQNPIPDYYGEKIASVKDYRRWLKDQRAFNLKKNKNMI